MHHITYTGQLFEEDGQIVALCPELSVSSFGDTPPAALAALQEAVELFLETCQEMETLDFCAPDLLADGSVCSP